MDKSFVAMEKHICIVCGTEYDTGSILLHKQLHDIPEEKALTGMGVCPEHQKQIDDGYIFLIVADETKSSHYGTTIKHEDAYRTGELLAIRRTAAEKIFINVPFDKHKIMYIDTQAAAKIKAMVPKERG